MNSESRAMDARVAVEIMGYDLRGTSCAVFVEGAWSIHPDSEPEGWACYAGMEPVYKLEGEGRSAPDPAEHEEFWGEYESKDRVWREEVETWERDQARFGCHHHDLEVVPNYSTTISDAWLVVEKMRAHPDPRFRTLQIVSYPYARTYATFDMDKDGMDWSEANGEHADCEAICLAALEVAALEAVK